MSEFTAIDVETANANLSTICQIGVVQFHRDGSSSRWQTLVDPCDFFDWVNIRIHGIDQVAVHGAPRFPEVWDTLSRLLEGATLVSHTHFDRVALQRACDAHALKPITSRWLDSARVARRAWPDQFAKAGYGLSSVADYLNISYRAHDAVEDAWAAGMVLHHAVRHTGISVHDWLVRINQPLHLDFSVPPTVNSDGPLFGEVVCFTGALSIPRREAATEAAAAGCIVASGVTRDTTILVVGDQDARRLAGHELSSKHRKAEKMIEMGQDIRILTESDFVRVLRLSASSADSLPPPLAY